MKRAFIILLATLTATFSAFTQESLPELDKYIISRTVDETGREIIGVIVPGSPPRGKAQPVASPSRSAVLLPNVPAFSWCFGCSPTAAAMAAGYYDNMGYWNMYTGPTNGGLMPMNNSAWGTVTINGETITQCPLSATRDGLDGRSGRGHIDDYWVQINHSGPDPWIVNDWIEHEYEDCTGDYMGTSQSALGNPDGGTLFYFIDNGNPLYNYTGAEPDNVDGCHGIRDFYESRGYTVNSNYTQWIYGYLGNTLGFTFQQFMDEIDAGRPVMIHVTGHSMLGMGYDESTNTIYLHDTWDYNLHSMTWAGSYSGMTHWGVTVVELAAAQYIMADFNADFLTPALNTTVVLTDLSYGSPDPDDWSWSITPGTFAYVNGTSSASQNPEVQFTAPGSYNVSLTVSNGIVNDTETKAAYITAYDCSGFTLPFSEDFSDGSLPACWMIIDHEGNGQVWSFDNPGGRTINTTTAANGFAILDSDDYGSGNGQDCDLITPPIDMSDAFGVRIAFQHFYAHNTGSAATLSCSIDGGGTWTVLQTWNATTSNPAIFSMEISALAAGQANVRFKWNYTGTWDWFWAIDDLVINTDVPGLWTGEVSDDWTLAGNWCSGALPGSSTDITVHPDALNWPAYSGDLVIGTNCGNIFLPDGTQLIIDGSLTISAGKSLTFEGEGLLSVSGDWLNLGTFNAGTGTVEFFGTGPSEILAPPVSISITDYIRTEWGKSLTLLTSPTTWASTTSGASTDVSLGFTFNYLGNAYTIAHLCSYGWMSLDGTTGTASNNGLLFTTGVPNLTLAPWWDYLRGDPASRCNYKTEGSEPNRVFTAEWYRLFTYVSTATARITFQVKLFESSGVIEFHYGLIEGSTTHSSSESASIGIEDATGGSGHFIEATTGSNTVGVSNLKSPDDWPECNYRFTPPVQSYAEQFHDLCFAKAGAVIDITVDTEINGSLTVSPGTQLNITEGITLLLTGGD